MKEFFSGCLEDKPDERDYDLCMALEYDRHLKLPDEFSVWTPPLENQESTQNCVAQSLAAIIECYYHKLIGCHEDFSVGYIYGNRIDDKRIGTGMYLRDACGIVAKYGDVQRDVWECLDEVPDVINEFNSVYESIKDKAWFPFSEYVSFLTPFQLQAYIYTYKLPAMINCDASKIYSGAGGRHAVICYGWNEKNQYLCQNSWGDSHPYPLLRFTDMYSKWGLIPMEVKYKDIKENEWYYNAIKEATEDGILNGYPDGTFRPDQQLTRAELSAFYQRLKKLIIDKK